MKMIALPAGTQHVRFDELAHLMACALWPLRDDGSPGDGLNYGFALIDLERELVQAVESKDLPVKNPLTFGQYTRHVSGVNLADALVRLDDFRTYAVDRGILVAVDAPESKTRTACESSDQAGAVVLTSDGPAPIADTAKPAVSIDRGWVMKKAALITKHECQWSTIKRDFQDASENGLSKAAKAPGHGNWFEADALNWARQRGKLIEATEQQAQSPATPFSGLQHRIKH